MPMDSVSDENVEKLLKEHCEKQEELTRIKETTIEQMWLSELTILENEYNKYKQERALAQLGEVKVGNKKTVIKVMKKIIKTSPKIVLEEVIV
jgi:hypothetical protein